MAASVVSVQLLAAPAMHVNTAPAQVRSASCGPQDAASFAPSLVGADQLQLPVSLQFRQLHSATAMHCIYWTALHPINITLH